jgi:hypothetical protein
MRLYKGEFNMQRNPIIASIFGYLVCLLTVAIFFMSVAGVVNNAFRVANPTATHRMIAAHHIGRRFGMQRRFGGGWMSQQGGQTQAPMAPQSAMGAQPQAMNPQSMRARFIANARFDAIRRLIVALVLLVLSIGVFRRTFQWLNPLQAAAT